MDIYLIFICIIGLCLGSFYNVVILRSISGESIVFPPSKCPKCGKQLYFWHNIPVLSYLLLRGKCYFCHEKISIQYPLVEIATMLLFAFTYLKYGLSWNCLFCLILESFLLIMTITDIKTKTVDCVLAIALGVCGILFNWIIQGSIVSSLVGLITAVVILEVVARLGIIFTKSRAMGEADTYVAGALGACFGFPFILTVLIYSLVASMIFILPVFFYHQYKNNNKFVCIASVLFILSVLFFKTVMQNYYSLAVLVVIAIALIVAILKSMKTAEKLNYLPFVPAFALGTCYLIFFS